MNESLKRVQSKYPLVVAITDEISKQTQRTLEDNNIEVIRVNKMNVSKKIIEKNSNGIFNHWNNTFDKLSIFELTKFKKLVFLDSDMYIRKNIDELFTRKGLSAVIDRREPEILSTWVKLTSGTLVIEPEKGITIKFKRIMDNIIEKRSSIGDQDILQEYDKDWENKEELHLEVKYNTFFIYLDYYIKENGYKLDDIAIIHFILKIKPWNLDYNKIDEYLNFLDNRLKYNYELTKKEVFKKCLNIGNENKRIVLNEYLNILKEIKNKYDGGSKWKLDL